MEDGEECWVSFKYEHLPNNFYWCGCLDHSDRDCAKWIESNGTLDSWEEEYGPWIRAAPTQAMRKSVVVVLGFYEARKKGGLQSNTLVTEIQKSVRKECRGQANHANSTVEKVAVNSEEEIMEEINVHEKSKLEMVEKSNSGNYGENNSGNYGVIYGHNGDPLEDQILEIDRELNSVEITKRIERGEASLNKEVHVDSPNADSPNKIPEILETSLEASVGHVASLSSLTDEPKTKKTKKNKKNKPDTQGRASSHEGKEGQEKIRTWTRVARFAQKGDAQAKAEAAGTSKRSFMEIDNCELPNKRRLVDHVSQKKISMVEVACQPHKEQ